MFNKVSWGSVARAFVTGVGAYVVPRLLDYLGTVNATSNVDFSKSALIAFLAGVAGAAVRAVLPYLPLGATLKGEK